MINGLIWQKHDGGAIPCDYDARVIVKLLDGATEIYARARNCSWTDENRKWAGDRSVVRSFAIITDEEYDFVMTAKTSLHQQYKQVVSKKRFILTKIPLGKKDRMLRLGFGLHDGRPFFRVDLWKVGYRLSRGE